MAELNHYFAGETMEVTGTITDSSNDLANPDVSRVARIADPQGVVKVEVAAGTMTNEGLGLYFFAYDIPAVGPPGTWTYEVIATDGAGNDVTIGSNQFVVDARAIAPA